MPAASRDDSDIERISMTGQQRIGELAAQLAAVMNASDDAILSKRLDGRIESWNSAASRMLGYSSGEIVGRSVMLIIPSELHEQERQLMKRLEIGDRVDHLATVRLAKSGERVPVSLTIAPVREQEGNVTEVFSIARDMRDHDRERELLENDRRKNDFIALLGHELRNPVAPIYNASELLSRTLRGQPQAFNLCSLIQRQAKQLSRLVDDLLDVNRISQGRLALDCRPIRLSQALSQSIEAAIPLLQAKHHQLIFSPATEEIYVNADASRLTQCISNLLTNAAKFTHPGGRIAVSSRIEGQMAAVEVSDNGCGISRELIPRIFDLYFQADRTLVQAQGGLGIGLSVVRRLIEMQHGNVEAYSEGPGRGATFRVRLPMVSTQQADAVELVTHARVARRIYIVDDNVDGATTLALLLRADGHSVRVVQSAQEALEDIDAFRPEVALIDIGLPEMDGYELLGHLRAKSGLQSTKFVALTGYPKEDANLTQRSTAFDAYLTKPVDADRLARTIGELLLGTATLPSAETSVNS